MRILLVHNRYRSDSPSGEDRVVDQEEAALAAEGHTLQRFERSSDDISRRSAVGKAFVPIQIVWNDQARRALRSEIRKFRPHVVHLHNTFPLLSASVLYACRAERVPLVVTIHNYRMVCPAGPSSGTVTSATTALVASRPLVSVTVATAARLRPRFP